MEGAQGTLWYVRECKESDDEERRNMEKREDINKSGERGKSSDHLVVLYISAHVHKTFDSWKLRLLHPPKPSLSFFLSLSIYLSIHLSLCLTGSSENKREKSDFHITDCYDCHYIP